MHRPPRKRGTVGLLPQAAAVLAVSALGAGLLEAAIPTDAVIATRNGGGALAASVLRAVSHGTLAAATCVAHVALLVLCCRGVALCWNRARGWRPDVRRA
ncbi:hypothetical protein J7F02_27675 [Streptomyces sp. ISL-112]|uniref:hypothetical protein n=1 Tax=unclassified Streptomyces TaxID=2593676 RepID=UPI001BE761C2|nr:MULTISPECIES: hypothetical protein [unclassified Streptomyces]MBT2429298.1 hypothetical protein [Streptomyces sp. ISL-112]MBT2460472.1 hypothetical protein [Streptomyces sp. ISL-63]